MNIFKLISQIDSQKDLSEQQLVWQKRSQRSPLVKFLLSSSSGTLVIKLGLAATFLLSTTKIAPAQPPSGTVCYVVSDGSSPDKLVEVDINTGVASNIGSLGLGITNVEAIAYWPITGTLYGANADRLGTINTATGTFTPVGTTFGSGNGSAGSKNFNDIDGLTFDPHTGELYGSVRDGDGGAPEDLLIKIDPATGAHIPDAFGPGVDYLVIRTASVTGFNDVDDITIDPDDGQLYGIANQGGGSTDRFVKIDRIDGTVTLVGSFGLSDVEGMNSFNDGSIYLSTGNRSNNSKDDRFYQVNKASGSVTELGNLNSLGSDYEGIACLTGAPNTISGTVFFDDGGTTGTANDGILNGDEAGNDGVTVSLFRDSDASGTVTAADILLTTQVTSGGGNYSFVVASTGDFVLEIDQNNIPAGQSLTTDNLQVANFGVSLGASDTGNNFGHASPLSLDYGDAPDTYGTDDTGGNSSNSNDPVGASHVIEPKLYLGATVPDADSNGFVDGTDNNGNATDDDEPSGTGNGDDEDDLTLPTLTAGDTSYTIPAANITATNTTGQAATLHAWIDFDNSGTFESTEHTSVQVNDATNGGNAVGDLTWNGITAGAAGNTYARFRLTTDSSINNTTPGGAASDGEVEDYQIAIAPSTPARTPFACSATDLNTAGLLVQASSSIWYPIDLASGNFTPEPDDYSETINGAGFNVLDGLIYGNGFNNQVFIMEADYNVTFSPVIPGLNTTGKNMGDVDLNGILYLSSTFNENTKIYRIDVDPTSGSYLSLLSTITLSGDLTSFNGNADFSVHPIDGNIYWMNSTKEMFRINPTTGATTKVGTVGGAIGSLTSDLNRFGASFFDADGFFYLSQNTTGDNYRIDLRTPASLNSSSTIDSALISSINTSVSLNDGARCPLSPVAIDFGDAPDTTVNTSSSDYQTLLAQDGPRHTMDGTTFLGSGVTADTDAFSEGTDDNNDASDDSNDDGVQLNSSTLQGQSLTQGDNLSLDITTAGTGVLNAWIDWNGNGDFEAGEQIATDADVSSGTLSVNVPAGAMVGNTYARFRYSSDTGLTHTGAASDGEVEDYQIAIAPGTITISGRVFEDMNYGGGAGRNFVTAEASATNSGFLPLFGNYATATAGARVELYSYDGIDTSSSQLVQEADTDDDGNYLFEDDSNGDPLPSGHYLIRVVNNTIFSNREENFTGEIPLAVQTFRHDPDETEEELKFPNEVGGAHPAEEDPESVINFGDPLPSNAQSVTAISGAGEVNNVDFGFNFNTIVNTNPSGQGSLPQFILNSKEFANNNLAQDLPDAITAPLDKDGNPVNLKDYETSIFMIPDPRSDSRVIPGTGIGQINLTTSPPDGGTGSAFVIDISSIIGPLEVVDFYTSIDGRTQTVNIPPMDPTVSNAPNLTIGSNETTGPEIIISKSSGGDIIHGKLSNLIFHSLGIISQGSANSVGLLISSNGTTSIQPTNTDNVIMEELTVSTSNCGIGGVAMTDSVIRNSIIRDSGRNSRCNNIQLRSNSDRNLIEDNLILRSPYYGIQLVAEGNSDNTIKGNEIVGNGFLNQRRETSGIGLRHSTNTTILENIIRENIGDGITVTNNSPNNIGNVISKNSIFNNGDLGIDLGSGASGDGVTLNDAGDVDNNSPSPNLLQNFPVINNIILDETNYTIEGSLETTPNTEVAIELYSNAVCNPNTSGTAQSDNYGEGEKYHDTMTVTTDSSGQATFSIPVAISDLAGNIFTTTATATSSNNTSEFSQCFGLSPDLLLVKRITAINPDQLTEIQFNNFVDDSSDDDNNVNWLGFDNSDQSNTYTLGEIDGGLVKPGDEVEYTIYFLSSGSQTAKNVLVCDLIPENMEFISQSFNSEPPAANGLPGAARGILWQYDGNIESLTDGTDGDAGYYFPPGVEPRNVFPDIVCDNSGSPNTNGAVVVNLGDIPGATDPGIPTNSYGFIRFRAKVK